MTVTWKQIPGFPEYIINAHGIILQADTGKQLSIKYPGNKPTRASVVRRVASTEEFYGAALATLLATLFLVKPIETSELSYRVAYKDGNRHNCIVDNLYWEPAPNTLIPEAHRRDFKKIPLELKQDYFINTEGTLVTSRLWRKMAWCIDKDGYRTFKLTKTNGSGFSIGQHRLLALAFLPCPGDPKNYQVNHKDGNKLNNKLENLEWVTACRNVNHALETGLATINVFTVLKRVSDGSLVRFKSIGDAARHLGSNIDRVSNAITNKCIIKDHYAAEVSRERQLVQWEDGTTTNVGELSLRVFTKTILSFDIITRKIEIWDNPSIAARKLSIDHSALESRATMQTPWPVKNYCFLWGDAYKKGSRFRDFTPEELLCFKDQSGIKNPVKVTDDLGNVRIFRSAEYAAKALSTSAKLVGKAIHGKTKIDGCAICYLQ